MDVINYSKIKKTEADLASHKEDYMQFKNDSTLESVKIEKELNDYKAAIAGMNPNQEPKQKVNGYGIVSLPKNAANGQVSDVVIKGLTATQLVKNGNFADGKNNWNGITGVVSIVDNVLVCGMNDTFTVEQNISIPSGNKFYIKANGRAVNEPDADISISVRTGSTLKHAINLTSADTVWTNSSNVFTASDNLNSFRIGRSAPTTKGAYEVRYFFVVNLTQTFGAGNEPTKEQCDAMFPYYFDGTKSTVSAIRLTSKNEDETEQSTQYITAKDEEGKIAELRSLPNGVKDEVSVSEGKVTQGVSDWYALKESNLTNFSTSHPDYDLIRIEPLPNQKHPVDSELEVKFKESIDISYSGGYIRLRLEKGKYSDLIEARADLAGTTLIYQLAEPIETPVQVSGTLVSYPNGTVYIEPFVADAGIYTDKMSVLHQDLPIKVLERLSKIDFMTGLETELDVSDAIIAEDKLSFTHPDLVEGDIVFFVYEYDQESTEGETEIEYYDSRYVIKDSVTDKFYKWHIAVADGEPSIELTEV